LVTALADEGVVAQDPTDGRYVLGPRLYALVAKLKLQGRVERVAAPHLYRLVFETNETALLGVYQPAVMRLMFVTAVESSHPLRYAVDLHTYLPLHAGASGLAILAFLPADQQETVLANLELSAVTQETIVDIDALRAELDVVRSQGYSCSHGQRIPGAVGVAAPILDAVDEVVGDVMVTVPEPRFVASAEAVLANAVMACAQSIARDLGRTA
jgi:DNA-binding IclR family transcriptional regulator